MSLLAPTLSRAQRAVRALGGDWRGWHLVADSPASLLARRERLPILLHPKGRSTEEDLAFLRGVRERFLWPVPSGGLRAAIAGLRGEEGTPRRAVALTRDKEDRRIALLLEGTVTFDRAQRALAADTRDWIVESPLDVRLTDRQLKSLARAGVRWSALEPPAVVALVASPALARARKLWLPLLPPRTRVILPEP